MATPYSSYPIPRTGTGFHDSSDKGAIPENPATWAHDLAAQGVTVYKILADGTNKVGMAAALVRAGIVPIVRLYGERPHPRLVMHPGWVAPYVAVGAKLFEWGNEPNIGGPEWKDGVFPPRDQFGRLLGDQWLRNAAQIRSEGGTPMFVAMTPGGYHNHRTAYRQILDYLRSKNALGTLEGAALAIHPRPHTVPPHVAPTADLTVAFKEYEWIAALFREYIGWVPPMYATEHGYSPDDSTPTGYPPVDENKAAAWNKVLFEMMNPAHPDKCPPYVLGLCYWLETGGGVWRKDEAFRGRFPHDPTIWGQTFMGMTINWDRRAYVTGGAPAPVPPPPPEPTPTPQPQPDREIINKPDWITFEEPQVAAGTEYWELTRFRFVDEQDAGGKTNIFIMDPHDANVWARAYNTGTGVVEDIRLDKPANEPAGNFPMYGIGNMYDVVLLGLPSVKVKGMHLPGNRHVVYELTYARRRKALPPTGGFMIDRRYMGQAKLDENYDRRPAGVGVDGVILHHTGGSFAASLAWLTSAVSGVGTHYLIDRDGSIYQLVEDSDAAWHAGYSIMNGRENCNLFTLGVELVNNGDGVDPYPQPQQDALIWLLKEKVREHGIPRSWVQSHQVVRANFKAKYPNATNPDGSPIGTKTDPRGLDMKAILDRAFGGVIVQPAPVLDFAKIVWQGEDAARAEEREGRVDNARWILKNWVEPAIRERDK